MSYIGLAKDVRYRIEIGFAFVDDGMCVYKLEGAIFRELIGSSWTDLSDTRKRNLVEMHPSVFQRFDKKDHALRSGVGRTI